MKIDKNIILDNIKTLFYAGIIAILIRSLFLQPFYIPSYSMDEWKNDLFFLELHAHLL